MPIDLSLLALLGRRRYVTPIDLNPQPIPPKTSDGPFFPHPFPPFDLGSLVGREVVRMAWTADLLEVSPKLLSDWKDDPCPTWPKVPHLPPHLPPLPDPEPGPDWIREYLLGVASTLAEAAPALRGSAVLLDAAETAARSLQESIG